MKDCKVNILGTEYDFRCDLDDKKADGISWFYNKKIKVRPVEDMLDEYSTTEEKLRRQKETARHELLHCFFFVGTGMDYSYDENLINFLAVQAPKIFDVFQELDLL